MLWYLCQLNAADSVSRRVLHAMAGIIAGVIIFLAGRFIVAPGSTSTVLAPSRSAMYMALYRLAFLGALGLMARASILLLQRYRRAVPPSELADRLRLMCWAAYVFVAFVLFESLRTVRVVPTQVPQAVGETMLLLFVLLLVLSLTTTIWGPFVRLPSLLAWLDNYHQQRYLVPLWRALYHVNPTQSLASRPGPLGAWLIVQDLHFRLLRLVVEVRTGISPYCCITRPTRSWRRSAVPPRWSPRSGHALCSRSHLPARGLAAPRGRLLGQ